MVLEISFARDCPGLAGMKAKRAEFFGAMGVFAVQRKWVHVAGSLPIRMVYEFEPQGDTRGHPFIFREPQVALPFG